MIILKYILNISIYSWLFTIIFVKRIVKSNLKIRACWYFTGNQNNSNLINIIKYNLFEFLCQFLFRRSSGNFSAIFFKGLCSRRNMSRTLCHQLYVSNSMSLTSTNVKHDQTFGTTKFWHSSTFSDVSYHPTNI